MYTLSFALRTRCVSHVAAIAMQWRRRLLGLVDYQVERNYMQWRPRFRSAVEIVGN